METFKNENGTKCTESMLKIKGRFREKRLCVTVKGRLKVKKG